MENKSRPDHKKKQQQSKKRDQNQTLDIHGTENSGTMRWQRRTYYTRVQKKGKKQKKRKSRSFPNALLASVG